MTSHSRDISTRRGEILAAAARAFDAHGYAQTTVETVAVEAGLSKGSIYNYFHSKAELFTQVFVEALAVDEAALESLLTGPASATEKLQGLMDNWFQRFGDYKTIGRLVLECLLTAARDAETGTIASTVREVYGRWRQKMAAVVAEGIDSGEFREGIDPLRAASLVMATLDGTLIQAILSVGMPVDAGYLAALKQGLQRGFSADGAAQERLEEAGER